jgi:hypothetical protein
MKIKWFAAGALAGSVLLPMMASAAGSPADCDRACLQAIAEQYLVAIPTHDPGKAPLAQQARYTENGVELPLPDGLWRTASALGKYRLYVTDPVLGEVGVYTQMQENGAPVLVATRLQVVAHKIAQIESIVARQTDFLQGGDTPGANVLGDAPRAQFLQVLPPGSQRSRQEMIEIANTYFSGIENNDGSRPPLFADDCNRIENGTYTTNRPKPAQGEPTGQHFSCKEAFKLGYYHDDTRLRTRRFLAVDTERGLVYTQMAIDHDATIRSYKLRDGRTVTVKRTAPWTWLAHEVFQINAEGKISQVEAILLSVPYGMRPGWDTGVHVESPAAIRDRYRE